MMQELGVDMAMRLHIDSTAAKGIIERVGLHKVRHLDVDMLWLQSQTAKETMSVHKMLGEDNVAELMTKNLGVQKIDKCMEEMDMVYRTGRSEKASKLYNVMEAGDDHGSDDSWGARGGANGIWSRIHENPRSRLFVPGNCTKGPDRNKQISNVRRTTGTYISGEKVCIVDDWTNADNKHKKLKECWTGKTIFTEFTS